MTVSVAEYLGIRTDMGFEITPVTAGSRQACPFKASPCEKVAQGKKPICSVRDVGDDNTLWISCEHRLCSTTQDLPLTDYQKLILKKVGNRIYRNLQPGDLKVAREVRVPVESGSSYSADFVMWRNNPLISGPLSPERPVILEMQGGGETSQTGKLTRHVNNWEQGHASLSDPVNQVGPIVTNAWRRQQEQFLVKGNVALYSGGKMVFCIGTKIYDYLMPRLTVTTKFLDLRNANWTLALLVFKESNPANPPPVPADRSIPIEIDDSKSLFTNYSSFVQAITNQGSPCTSLFNRPYEEV